MVASADVNVSVAHVRRNVMHLSIELTAEEAEYLNYILATERDAWEPAIGQRDDAQDCYDVCNKVLEALKNAVC